MRTLVLFTFLLIGMISHSQNAVEWEFSFNEQSKSIEAKAVISEGWHLYSQHIDNEIGPIPTTFEFEGSELYQLKGKTIEPTPVKEYDPNFEGELNFFKDEVVFEQAIEVKSSGEVKGMVTYMVCNDTMCLPPVDKEFTITIK